VVVILEFVAILFPDAAAWHTALSIIVTTVFAAFQLRGMPAQRIFQAERAMHAGAVVPEIDVSTRSCNLSAGSTLAPAESLESSRNKVFSAAGKQLLRPPAECLSTHSQGG